MTQAELALERFQQGYSCSQAVFSVLAEPLGLDTATAFRVAAGFGGGIARTAATCGCVTGAIMAIGMGQPDVGLEHNKEAKEKSGELARRMMNEFSLRNGATECRLLLGCDIGTPEGYQEAQKKDLFRLRCANYVRDGVEIVNQLAS
ncbi:MAG: C-GCAxxG-C-C family protein [Bryobacteraceae bacterium]